ncbi:MAG: S46 family peptidase [Schleiferiaceae bacterium]|nr:S46 family peptidase [Schleiferiaceae bacterium]
MKFINFLFFLFLSLSYYTSNAGEGMWLPFLLSDLNESEMRDMGLQLTAEDIYSVNQSSLKDAIISFGGFCTGEVISNKGLILTNHHCGYGQIQKHSTLENDYLKNGFWAMNHSEEKTNPGLKAIFVKYMEDVTNRIMAAANGAENREMAIQEEIAAIIAEQKNIDTYDHQIKPFFYGNQYILIATESYGDVRLVGAPPSSIGKYGADTDNWMWPRHTGDFALFRIYANRDNQPAAFSSENVPYTPERFLEISLNGVKDGDFTMIFGFPGRTEQYLPGVAVQQIMEVVNPARIAVRDELLAQLDRRMRVSDAVRIQYAAKYARISNGWKKWKGENLGLQTTDARGKKAKREAEFQELVSQNEAWQAQYGSILEEFNTLYASYQPHVLRETYFSEVFLSGLEAVRIAYTMKRFVENPTEKSAPKGLDEFYKDYNHEVQTEAMIALFELFANALPESEQPRAFVALGKKYKGNWAKAVDKLTKKSSIATEDPSKLLAGLEGDLDKVAKQISNDAFYQFAVAIIDEYLTEQRPASREVKDAIDALQTQYMEAQLNVFGEDKRFYPDANSTLRVSYGQVEPFSPVDGITYNTQTYLDGVIAKYIPGDYEFDLPKRLIELYESKDFGPYADTNGKMPVCFIASNHTTGGNSGSPALDAHGRLIGLNFDRAWEGTMSDINYDISRCRNIMVDARYILFIVDKFAGAGYLLEEMTLVETAADNL